MSAWQDTNGLANAGQFKIILPNEKCVVTILQISDEELFMYFNYCVVMLTLCRFGCELTQY